MDSEIVRSHIAEKVKMKLWAISAGRCELCNRLLYQDSTFGYDGNFGEMAHIHAVSQDGPRHKLDVTQDEINNIDNLMILCEEHHHMIDNNPNDFKDGLLIEKKKNHEARIREATNIPSEQSCRIVKYFSNINNQMEYSSDRLLREAVLLSGRVPLQTPTIDLSSGSSTKYKSKPDDFRIKAEELEIECRTWFDDIIKKDDCIGIFALAPQSLLFKLGTIINDHYNTVAFQCNRNGHKWAWPIEDEPVEFIIHHTGKKLGGKTALVLDLSATVLDERITSILGKDTSIYHLTLETPSRDFVKSERIQDSFVKYFRKVLETIKTDCNACKEVHVFPVMPNSLAIRAGMDYMPKTDPALILYEQASKNEGFFDALTIGG